MRFRAPVPDDAPAVLAVLAAREEADAGVVEYTLEDLHDEWRASNLDLARDVLVVEADDGQVVAYAAVRRHGARAVVDPGHEGDGIGSRVLEWVERREREQGRELHRQWVAAGNASARSLLTGAGYRRARSYARMVRVLNDVQSVVSVPAGFRLRPLDVARDGAAVHAIDAASFASTPDYAPQSLAEFREEFFEASEFAPDLSRVAVRDEQLAGFLLARRRHDEAVGYVDILAVHPEHQGLGVGTALLRSAFVAFAAAGLREARLGVASYNDRGMRIYERAGMTVQHQTDIYERPAASEPRRWRSYRDVDAAAEPESLAEQLDDIASVSFVHAEKRRSLELLELGAGASVLDVGCGTGVDLDPLAELVGAQGRVVGLERSATLLDAARGRGRERAGAIELVQGDGLSLPFADGEFDACRADRALQHVERPEAALAEMIRVVRPGGRVVVTESRWGLVAPSLDQALTDRVLGQLGGETGIADWLGHRLPVMFEEAGLVGVETFSADYTALERDELLRFTHLHRLVDEAVRLGFDDGQARAWLSRLEELVEQGEAFAVVLILHVVGTRQ